METLSALLDIIVRLTPLWTLVMTLFLAWYINYAIKKQLYRVELRERRLKEFYRPMDIVLRASKMAFKRYFESSDEEKKFIAKSWYDYNNLMKKLIMEKSYLFLEPELPPEVDKLIEHIDVFLFDYDQYSKGLKQNPFPGIRGYPFPKEVNDYFATKSQELSRELGKK